MLRCTQRIPRQRGQELLLPAKEIAQHGIDQCAERASGDLPGRRHGLVDHGMRSMRLRFEAIQGDQQ